MNLMVRLNTAFGAGFLLVMVMLALVLTQYFRQQAQDALAREAGLMLDSAVATREYTSAEILPLLTEKLKSEFVPQSIPFYAATQDFLQLRARHPEYSYKEATLNPTNPRDRAMDWEADLIQQFRNHPGEVQLSGERETPMGRMYYLARSIQVTPECLECHGQADQAPKTLLARYGANNGFGWQPREVVGAQVVSVSAAAAEAGVHHAIHAVLLTALLTLAVLWVALNVLLSMSVVRPLKRIIAASDEISQGNTAVQLPQVSGDWRGLVRAFERMRMSLEKAMKLLER
jgi:protein-histidine pros-kinase